ncbi:unnamed protein product, partial [Medioppia subpectinata]
MAKSETRIGLLSVNESNQKMRIIVNGKQLIIQEMCVNNDPNLLTIGTDDHNNDHNSQQPNLSSRLVNIHRNESLGLGLSIKGGSEHSLPILISRI